MTLIVILIIRIFLGIIAGTIGLLAIWFFRSPIVSALDAMLSDDMEEEGYNTDEYE